MDVEHDSGASRKRRECWLRSWLMHERQIVRMVLSENLHHSSAPFSPRTALRGPVRAKTWCSSRCSTRKTPQACGQHLCLRWLVHKNGFCGALWSRSTSSCARCRFSAPLCRRLWTASTSSTKSCSEPWSRLVAATSSSLSRCPSSQLRPESLGACRVLLEIRQRRYPVDAAMTMHSANMRADQVRPGDYVGPNINGMNVYILRCADV